MITLVHGFNVKDPQNTVGKLKKYLPDAIMFNYGWRFFSVLWHNKKDAKVLKNNLNNVLGENDERIVYAHSNGAAISVDAARQGARITTLVLINPALKVNTNFPSSIDNIIIIYTKHDKATAQARFWDKVPLVQLIIPNAWGAMGTDGYKGDDCRVTNMNLSEYLKDHSDFFSDKNLDKLMPMVMKCV